MLDLCVSSNCAHGKPSQVLTEYASPFFARTQSGKMQPAGTQNVYQFLSTFQQKNSNYCKRIYKDLEPVTIGILKHK
jgi:hypothetical protein